MHRVSSRQRLVSWDAFEASVEAPEEAEQLKHKTPMRISSEINLVPAYDWEFMSFSDLHDDIQSRIFSLLDMDSLRAVSECSHATRELVLASAAARQLWNAAVKTQKWPWLPSNPEFRDDTRLETTLVSRQPVALPQLVQFAPMRTPSGLDTALSRSRQQVCLIKPFTVKFTGQVGLGNRCLRANAPFPSCPPRLPQLPAFFVKLQSSLQCKSRQRTEIPRPFVIPYCQADGVYNVTPRWVFYFEAKIEETSEPVPSSASCIAIGLASSDFMFNHRMPGWDSHSYGYHGDDGGIFHQTGHMIQSYGPRFGAGDTVGCGIDLLRRTIFFTLNGKFLGDAFGKVKDDVPWYPVVGLDSHNPVAVNFGTHEAFCFDLTGYREKNQNGAVSHYLKS